MYPDFKTSHPADNSFANGGEANNSVIKFPVSIGQRVTDKSSLVIRDIAYVMNCVRTGIVERQDIRSLIETIRLMPNDKMAAEMKKQLPYFLGSVCEGRRSNETVKFTRFAIFDLDHVPDIETAKSKAIKDLPFIRWAFQSVRDGVKLIAQFDKCITDEKQYRLLWAYMSLLIEKALCLKVDSTPDWSRACFFSYDRNILENPHYQALNVAMAQKEAEFLLEISGKVKRSTLEFKAPNQDQKQSAGSKALWTSNSKSSDASMGSPETNIAHEKYCLKSNPANETGDGNKAIGAGLNSKADTPDTFSRARSIVQKLAQTRIPYRDWIKIGMSIYAGFGEQGRELWDLFLDNPHYSDSEAEMNQHWRSFASVHSITLETLFYMGEKYGCQA